MLINLKKSLQHYTMLILSSFNANTKLLHKKDIIPYLLSKKRHRKHTLYIHFDPVQQSPSSGLAAGSACKTQWSFAGQLCNKVTESTEPRIGVFPIGLANRMPVLCHLGASVFLCSQCLFTGISLHSTFVSMDMLVFIRSVRFRSIKSFSSEALDYATFLTHFSTQMQARATVWQHTSLLFMCFELNDFIVFHPFLQVFPGVIK